MERFSDPDLGLQMLGEDGQRLGPLAPIQRLDEAQRGFPGEVPGGASMRSGHVHEPTHGERLSIASHAVVELVELEEGHIAGAKPLACGVEVNCHAAHPTVDEGVVPSPRMQRPPSRHQPQREVPVCLFAQEREVHEVPHVHVCRGASIPPPERDGLATGGLAIEVKEGREADGLGPSLGALAGRAGAVDLPGSRGRIEVDDHRVDVGLGAKPRL